MSNLSSGARRGNAAQAAVQNRQEPLWGRAWYALPVAVLASLSVPAFSAEQVSGTVEEVVVTATKRTESLQDVPIAVSAFSGEDLANYGVSGTQGLQISTPGLVFSNTGALAQPYLRGVGTRLALSGLEPSVAVYVDDRYNSRTTSAMFDFADVERVEVLKGPQGILYGRNVTGGAIRIITKDVGDELEGDITASAGNYGYYALSGTVSVPITDTFGARFTALTKQRDGFVDNLSSVGASELDDQDYMAFRTKLRWDISETATARLTLDYSERDDYSGRDQVDLSPPGLATGIAAGGVAGRDPDHVATAIGGDDDSDAFSAQLRFDVAVGALDLVSVTTYYDFEQVWGVDADGTSAQMIDVLGQPETAEEFSQEFQLLSNSDGPIDWILGANFYSSEVRYDGEIVVANGALNISQGQANVDTTAYAAFGQVSWDINERWTLTLGGRWSYEEKDVKTLASPLPVLTVVPVPFEDEEDWDEFTPQVTLEYNADNYLLYLTYSRGFKSGGFNHPAPGSSPLDPEILDMYELGFKADLAQDTVRFNASAYYYDYKDLQVTRAAAGESAQVTTENAADAEVLGLDVDLTWFPTANLQLTAGASILDTEYTSYPSNAKVFNVNLPNALTAGMSDVFYDASGESMLRAPDLSAFLSVQYDFQVGSGTMPLIVSYAYKDDFNFDFVADPLSKELEQKAYSVLNARLSYVSADESWTVSLWGNNLTDEEYFDDKVANGSGLRGSFAPPRTYGVDVKYSF